MSMVAKQAEFLLDMCKLIQYATHNDFVVTAGEAFRTLEQQQIYLKTGRSKTLNSQHLERLAMDLNIFKDGRLCGHDEIEPIGKFWESLNGRNRWGGSWRGAVEAGRSHFIDSPHFERME